MKYLVNLDLNKNEIQNAVIQPLATAPSNGVLGQIYYNTTNHHLYQFDGTNWVQIGIEYSDATTSASGLMSASDKVKLNGIASGAEVNVQSDWNQTTTTADDYIKNKPTTMPPSSHAHGNITYDGNIQTDITIASGDQIVVTDASNLYKVALSGISFDGSTTTKALTPKGTWATFLQSHQTLPNEFGKVKVGSTTIEADTTTDTLELVAGSNVTLTPDATNDKVTIAATDTTYSAGTEALITAGTDTTDRVWQPKILHDYISSAAGAVDAMRFKGTIGTGGDVTTLPTTGVKVGDTYRVITAGTYAGQVCEVGDLIIATATTPTWTVAQTNIDGAITSISGTAPITVSGSGSSRTVAVNTMTGATSSAAGTSGVVPAPAKQTYPKMTVLSSDGTWNRVSLSTSSIAQGVECDINIGTSQASATLSNATTSTNGAMSSSDKTKLDDLYSRVGGFWHDYSIIDAGDTSTTIDCSSYELPDPIDILNVYATDLTNNVPVVVDWSLNTTNYVITASIASAVTYDICVRVLLAPSA